MSGQAKYRTPGILPNFHISHVYINDFGQMYNELIAVLQGALQDFGTSCHIAKNSYMADAVNIFLGSTIFASKMQGFAQIINGRPYAVYQLEQLDDKLGLLHQYPEYLAFLKNSGIIFEYSPSGLRYLEKLDFKNVYYLPPGYHCCLEWKKSRPVQDIDVLFYGSPHARRNKIMQALADQGIKVFYLPKKFGAERNHYIERAKIVLNVHAWDNMPVLETIRLSFLLANSIFVVSESSDHNPYKNGVIYAPYDKLVDVCMQYLQVSSFVRGEIAKNGYLAMKNQNMTGSLSKVFELIGEAGLSSAIVNTSISK